jgi:hypothetical protein
MVGLKPRVHQLRVHSACVEKMYPSAPDQKKFEYSDISTYASACFQIVELLKVTSQGSQPHPQPPTIR